MSRRLTRAVAGASAPTPPAKAPCAYCSHPIPAGRTWCGWQCRRADDLGED